MSIRKWVRLRVICKKNYLSLIDLKYTRILVGKTSENLNLDSFDFTYSQLGTDYSEGLSLTLRFKQLNTTSIPETDITV